MQAEYGVVVFDDPALDPNSPEYNSADPALQSRSQLEADGFDARALFDAAELYCQITENPTGKESACDLSSPPRLSTIDDLVEMRAYLHCLADDFENQAGRQIFPSFPWEVYNMLLGRGIGGFGATGGEYGESISLLRGALNEIRDVMPAMADEIRSIGLQMDELRQAMLDGRISRDIGALQIMSDQMDAMAQCDAALSPTYSFGVSSGSGAGSGVTVGFPPSGSYSSGVSAGQSEGASINPGAATATCANAMAQASFGGELQNLHAESLDSELKSEAIVLWDNYQQSISDLADKARNLETAFELIGAQLSHVEGIREQAKRALSRALFMGSFQAESQEEISAALRARRDILRRRYKDARENAVKLSFLAKRAIEQRLGVRLSEMREDLPLVEAPSTWEAEVCTSSGLDYEALRDPNQDEGEAVETFAEAFVGDYVTKLENLIESYRLINDFQDGTDTAVISLRDDVHNVKKECEVEGANLLYHSNDLSHVVPPSLDTPGWRLRNCEADAGSGQLVSNGCFVAAPVNDGSDELLPSTELGKPVLWEINGNVDAELVQEASFTPGVYRLSWYGTAVVGGAAQSVGTATIQVVDDLEEEFPTLAVSDEEVVEDVWRSSVTFEVPANTPARVRIRAQTSGIDEVRLGGVMLERISTTESEDGTPGTFVETSYTRSVVIPACEDTTGEVFRADHWRYGCDRLCQDGFTGTCSGSDAETHCYYETQFNINQRSIEVGDQLNLSGFARGNFNYRIETVAVNFVGTGARNCADSPNPSACYGGGFIPYSLRHDGPFFVRNHLGQEFKASLFPGRIEHARGLATERYITNPISTSDRELLDAFTRLEFRGRPASGNFGLRVWIEPGVDFESIADVQVILKYRYWTKSE